MAKYIKPTLDTEFHIDFSWWQKKDKNLRAYLRSHLCPACKDLGCDSQSQTFDWISPTSGEVFQIDILWHTIRTHCSQDPAFFESHIPLTTAIFRIFIINDNTPLTPSEIYERLQKKSPELILKTIGGHQVYQGIKPVVLSV